LKRLAEGMEPFDVKRLHALCEDDNQDETDGIEVNDGFGI